MAAAIRDAFAYVLDHYVEARTRERIGKASTTWQRLMSIPALLADTSVVRGHPGISVRASAGQGAWARIPWIACLHREAATSTRGGLYVIYLFREDTSGVYLTLNQGVTEPIQRLGVLPGVQHVRDQARAMRERLGAMNGFEFGGPLDLRSQAPMAKHYAASTIAHKLYARDELPAEHELLADLGFALTRYDELREFERSEAGAAVPRG